MKIPIYYLKYSLKSQSRKASVSRQEQPARPGPCVYLRLIARPAAVGRIGSTGSRFLEGQPERPWTKAMDFQLFFLDFDSMTSRLQPRSLIKAVVPGATPGFYSSVAFSSFEIAQKSWQQLRSNLSWLLAHLSVLIFASGLAMLLQAPGSLSAQPLTIQRSSSSITFQIGSFWGDVDGRFNTWDSSVTVSSDFSRSSGQVTIQIASIDTNNSGRDEHLRDPDFFAASQFPTATYVLKSITSDENSVTTDGTITIRGTSRPLQIVFKKQQSAGNIRLNGSFSINRKSFGISYDSIMNPIDDNVRINLSILLTK